MSQSIGTLLQDGLRLHRQGAITQAVACYERVIQLDPSNVDARYYLAVVACQREDWVRGIDLARWVLARDPRHAKAANLAGRALERLGRKSEALASLNDAIAAAPDLAEPYGNRALVLVELGRLDDALSDFDRAVALNPDSAVDWQERGVLLSRLQRYRDAVDSHNRVLALVPELFEAHAARADALLNLNRLEEALTGIDRALGLRPDDAQALIIRIKILLNMGRHSEALFDLHKAKQQSESISILNFCGSAFGRLQQHEDALSCFERVLRLQPGNFDAHFNIGTALYQLDRYEEALTAFDRAIAVRPDSAIAFRSRGNSLLAAMQYQAAAAAFDKALELSPDDAQSLSARGAALMWLGRHHQALADIGRALEIAPDYPDALVNRGLLMAQLDRYEEALASYERAQLVQPDNALAHFNEAVAHLILGRFHDGLKKYEWRWKLKDFAQQRRDFEAPLWQGQNPIAGKAVLLHAEQGLGDAIQFMRYAPVAARHGARVILEVPPLLAGLAKTLAGVARVVVRGESLPAFELHCPLASLPLAFQATPDAIPADVPYLRAPSDRIAAWRNRLANPTRKVGLAWLSRPIPPGRSIPLASLAPLFSLPDVEFVSLQHEVSEDDLELLNKNAKVRHFGSEIADFCETAALVSGLDLVVTVDTVFAHLAGALGKPVWVLLSFSPHWSWFLHRDDSPWYPTARLFRQPVHGDWASVIADVRRELAHLT
jgi:tetratricopeptide (TPR) repeat protein